MSGPFIRLPSMDGLRAFEAAARLGSFEKAATELNVTASAVSKRVATLEELIGQPLFVRRANSLHLTADGDAYLGRISPVLHALLAIPQHQGQAPCTHRLRVTVPPTFARQILAPRIADFSSAHPHVDLEVVISPPRLDAPATDADIEIRNGDAAAHRGLQLMDDVVLPMAAPQLLARLPPLHEPRDLRFAPLLSTPLEPWVPWFRAARLDWPEPAGVPRLGDLGLTLEAAVSGQGVVLARPSLVLECVVRGALRPLFCVVARPHNQYYLLPIAPREPVQRFVQWLHQLCRGASERAWMEVRKQFSGSP